MFRAPRAHRQDVKIVLYSLWYHHTYRCDDEHVVLEICRGTKNLIVKQILCTKLVNY